MKCFFALLFALTIHHCSAIDADISFFIADVKWNEEEGVKICELQSGLSSRFRGYDIMCEEPGLSAKQLCDCISQFLPHAWIQSKSLVEPTFYKEAKKRGWEMIHAFSEIDATEATTIPKDPHNLMDYRGVFISRPQRQRSWESFSQNHPGIIVMNRAFFPYIRNKNAMNRLFEGDPLLEQLRPQYAVYGRAYSPQLVKKILSKFTSEYLVLKPINLSRGRGVTILHRGDLDEMLKTICQPRSILKKDKRPEIQEWAETSYRHFFVEEYAPSLPFCPPDREGLTYDPTMRVVLFFTYNQQQIDFHFVHFFWRIPKKALEEEGRLTEKHKNGYGEKCYYYEVAPEIQEQVKTQLVEAFYRMYYRVLNL